MYNFTGNLQVVQSCRLQRFSQMIFAFPSLRSLPAARIRQTQKKNLPTLDYNATALSVPRPFGTETRARLAEACFFLDF